MKREKRWPGTIETVCLLLLALRVFGLFGGYSLLQVLLLAIFLAGAIICTIIIWFVWR